MKSMPPEGFIFILVHLPLPHESLFAPTVIVAAELLNEKMLLIYVFGSGGSKNMSLKDDLNSPLESERVFVFVIASAPSKLRFKVAQLTVDASGPT